MILSPRHCMTLKEHSKLSKRKVSSFETFRDEVSNAQPAPRFNYRRHAKRLRPAQRPRLCRRRSCLITKNPAGTRILAPAAVAGHLSLSRVSTRWQRYRSHAPRIVLARQTHLSPRLTWGKDR